MSELTDEQMKEIGDIYQCFFPRANWASGTWLDSESAVAIAMRLFAMVRKDALRITFSSVKKHSYESVQHRWYLGSDGEDREYEQGIHAAVRNRRGKSDLKDEMWTGYRYLQAKYPGQNLVSHYRGLPFIYTSPDGLEGITAGNIEPETMLRWMVKANLTTLHLIGTYYGIPEGEAPYYHRKEGMTGMVTLKFANEALGSISEYFDDEDKKTREALRAVSKLMAERFNPFLDDNK